MAIEDQGNQILFVSTVRIFLRMNLNKNTSVIKMGSQEENSANKHFLIFYSEFPPPHILKAWTNQILFFAFPLFFNTILVANHSLNVGFCINQLE